MSEDWTEKYRPRSLSGIIGNPKAVNDLKMWADQWNQGHPFKRAVVLMGSPGIGKTTSAEALANDMGWGIVEMNASEQRTGEVIREIAIRGALSNTFNDDGEFLKASDGGRKLIVLDEADSLFGNVDRGAMPVINELIRTTRQPVILIVNDFYALSKKSAVIKNDTLQIAFAKPTSMSIVKALREIAVSEGIDASDDALKSIANNSNGDMRAAVRDFESVGVGKKILTFEDTIELSNREIRKTTYDLMYAIFRKREPMAARRMMMAVDEEPSAILNWVDENLPYEYRDPGDLIRGYEMLSRADIFLGRVMRRQYYGFWSYASDFMTAGVATARMSNLINRERFRFPSYFMKMSRTKGIRSTKASLCLKLATYTHNSTRRVASDILPPLKQMVASDPELLAEITSVADLEADEVAFLLNSKSDSKVVKETVEISKEMKEANRVASINHTPAPDFKFGLPSVPVPPKKAEPEQKTVAESDAKPTAKGQKSLFDF